jgi:hypothetical protein
MLGDLTIWSLFSALSLSIMTWVCVRYGDMTDMRAPVIFLLAYYGPYVIAGWHPPSGILFLVFGHTLLAYGFYALSERWYGDAVAYTYCIAALLGVMAVSGILPSEPGKGVAINYWHFLASLNHFQNMLVGVAVYGRHRELV